MEEHFVWMTTRQIKPGTLTEFERAWRPDTPPEGMLRVYAYWSEDEQQIIGVSFWASKQSCDAWRASEAEARRRAAMAPMSWASRKRSIKAGNWLCGHASSNAAVTVAPV